MIEKESSWMVVCLYGVVRPTSMQPPSHSCASNLHCYNLDHPTNTIDVHFLISLEHNNHTC
jgi:hypothetical protein